MQIILTLINPLRLILLLIIQHIIYIFISIYQIHKILHRFPNLILLILLLINFIPPIQKRILPQQILPLLLTSLLLPVLRFSIISVFLKDIFLHNFLLFLLILLKLTLILRQRFHPRQILLILTIIQQRYRLVLLSILLQMLLLLLLLLRMISRRRHLYKIIHRILYIILL